MKDAIAKLLKEGRPYNAIARELGCSKSTISYHARKMGLSKGARVPHYDWEAIQAFYDSGHSARECMRRFGCSHSTWDRAKNGGRIRVRPVPTYPDPICRCRFCGRTYAYGKGHTRSKCNSCMTNGRRFRVKQLAVAYKGGSCAVCGYSRCMAALTFHHLDPSKKDFIIGGAHARSWEKIRQELDKCVLLCSNCHHELHAGFLDLGGLVSAGETGSGPSSGD